MPPLSFSFSAIARKLVNQRELLTVAAAWIWASLWLRHSSTEWNAPTAAALILAASLGSFMAKWEENTPATGKFARELMTLVLFVAGLMWLALTQLPSGLALLGIPFGALLMAQGLLSAGSQRPWAIRLAIVFSLLLLLLIAANGSPAAGPRWLPMVLLGLFLLSAMGAWQTPQHLKLHPALLVILRGLIFAAGVMLPATWIEVSSFSDLFLHPEGMLTAAVGVIGAWAVCDLRRPSQRPKAPRRRFTFLIAAGLIAVVAALALKGPFATTSRLIPQAAGLWALGLAVGLSVPGIARSSLGPLWCAVLAAGGRLWFP